MGNLLQHPLADRTSSVYIVDTLQPRFYRQLIKQSCHVWVDGYLHILRHFNLCKVISAHTKTPVACRSFGTLICFIQIYPFIIAYLLFLSSIAVTKYLMTLPSSLEGMLRVFGVFLFSSFLLLLSSSESVLILNDNNKQGNCYIVSVGPSLVQLSKEALFLFFSQIILLKLYLNFNILLFCLALPPSLYP